MPASKPLRAVAIIRMSTDMQRASPDRQRSLFAEYCARWGLQAVGEYLDEGVSATHTDLAKRAGLMALVEDARAGRFDLAWCEMVDRIARKSWEFGLVRELLAAHGVAIVRDRDNPHEAADDADREFIQDLDAVLARREVRKTSQRVRSAQRRRVTLGYYRGGSLPLGLAWQWEDASRAAGRYVLEPEGAALVTRMMELYVQTGSGNLAALRLNEEGLPSATGRQWRSSAVMYLLRNPVYRGEVRYGEELHPTPLPQIVPPELVAAVDAQLQRSAGRPRRATGIMTQALFSGLLRCPECDMWLQASVTIKPDGRRYYTYRCRQASSPPLVCTMRRHIPQLSLARVVLPQAIARLQQLTVSGPGRQAVRHQAQAARRERLEGERQRIVGLCVRGRITEAEADRLLDDVARRLQALQEEPAPVRPTAAHVRQLLAMLGEWWDDLTVPEQRRLLQEVIDYIVPVPGRHHIQESQIFWRC